MKALEILKEIKNQKPFIYRLTSVWCRALVVNEPSKLDEAIAELEALQSRSCEGCKYQMHKINDVQTSGNWMKYSVFYDCVNDKTCKRNTADRYEAKEQL